MWIYPVRAMPRKFPREFVKIKSRSYCLISSELRLLCFQIEMTAAKCFSVKSPIFSKKSLFRLRLYSAVTSCPDTECRDNLPFRRRSLSYGGTSKRGGNFRRTDLTISFEKDEKIVFFAFFFDKNFRGDIRCLLSGCMLLTESVKYKVQK